MPPLVAELDTSPGYAPALSANTAGATGRKVWRVHTFNEDEALTAIGIPKIGEAYGTALYPMLRCVALQFEYSSGGATSALSRVTADYQTPRIGGAPPPVPGEKYTIAMAIEERTVNVKYDLIGGVTAKINNGDGASRTIGLPVYTIVANYPPSAFTNALRKSVEKYTTEMPINSQAFDLPAWPVSGKQVDVPKRHGKYLGGTIDEIAAAGSTPAVIRVTHRIAVAGSTKTAYTPWETLWQAEGPNGTPGTGAILSAYAEVEADIAQVFS